MELISTLLLIGAAIVIVAYELVTETTDWIGRAEIVETRWPRLWGLLNNRPMRLILIILAVAMLAQIVKTLYEGGESPEVRFAAPKVLVVQPAMAARPESSDSLRRRTMKLGSEVSDFLRKRFESHPPYAYPNSNEPSPSEERKAAIRRCVEYDQATADEYMRKYKDRMVGIVREYHAKGVPTGFLEQSLSQGPPIWVMPGDGWEENPQNQLGQFRELAFHIDANDQLISTSF